MNQCKELKTVQGACIRSRCPDYSLPDLSGPGGSESGGKHGQHWLPSIRRLILKATEFSPHPPAGADEAAHCYSGGGGPGTGSVFPGSRLSILSSPEDVVGTGAGQAMWLLGSNGTETRTVNGVWQCR